MRTFICYRRFISRVNHLAVVPHILIYCSVAELVVCTSNWRLFSILAFKDEEHCSDSCLTGCRNFESNAKILHICCETASWSLYQVRFGFGPGTSLKWTLSDMLCCAAWCEAGRRNGSTTWPRTEHRGHVQTALTNEWRWMTMISKAVNWMLDKTDCDLRIGSGETCSACR